MEVHHHPDIHHKKKNFKELFVEFIMIFLAVTLGFIAESVREAISNHDQEKHYAESLINNLEEDTTFMNIVIKENTIKIDTLQKLQALSVRDLSKKENQARLYSYAKKIGYYALFKSNDATMNQLKTSGLQFMKKDHVADSIASYDVSLKFIYASENLYTTATNEALMAAQQLMDLSISVDTSYFDTSKGFKDVQLPLYIDNTSSLPRFFNKVDFEIGAVQNYNYNIRRVLPLAKHLIIYLEKEYDIQ